MPNPQLVSIIIATKNRAFFLPKTLDVVTNQDYPNFEIIVVDNGSNDETREVVNRYQAKYIYCAENGIGAVRKKGVDAAQGELIAFCDDDTIPHQDWVSQLVQRFRAEDNIGLVNGLVNNIGGTGKGRGKIGKNGMTYYVEDPNAADYFGNANLAFAKSAYLKVGGYDPFFSVGYEEIDLALRFKQKGYQQVYEPLAVVDHYFTGVGYKRRWYYCHALMRLYFYFKHYSPKTLSAWIRFCGYELYLLAKDCARSLKRFWKKLISQPKDKQETISAILLDLINAVLARISIPYLWFLAHR